MTEAEQLRRALFAVLFMQGGMYAIDIFSAVNSSPWTAESFGGNLEKQARLRRYIRHAVVGGITAGALASIIGYSPWPIIGAGGITAYMVWLYESAITQANATGSQQWSD